MVRLDELFDAGSFFLCRISIPCGAIRCSDRQNFSAVIVISIICVAAGAYLIWLAFRSRGRRKTIIRATGLGEVRISSLAIETLIKRGAREVPGIQDVDTVVDVSGEDIEVYVSVVVSPDVSIPGVAEQIQTKLGRYISDTIGVDVSRVTVHVRNVGHEQRPQRVI